MSIFKRFKMLALIGVQLLMFQSLPAYAQFPTFDAKATIEGAKGKFEMLKQTKIVKDVTEQAGKLNSAIGDAKSSISKYAGDNLAKVKEKAEKLQKEKKRLEEKKAKLDKAKEKAEKLKENAEKAKKAMDDAKKKVQEAKDKIDEAKDFAADVKSKVDEAKAMAADVQSTVANAKSMAQNAVADAKGMAQGAISNAVSMANDARGMAQNAVSDARGMVDNSGLPLQRANVGNMQPTDYEPAMYGNYQNLDGSDDSFVDDYVAAYEAGINSDAKIYDRMPVSQGSYNVIPSGYSEVRPSSPMTAPMTATGKTIGRQAFGQAQAAKADVKPAGAGLSGLRNGVEQRPQSALQAVEGVGASAKGIAAEGIAAPRADLESLKADKLKSKAEADLAKDEAKAKAQLAKESAKSAKEAVKAEAKAQAVKADAKPAGAGLSSLKDSIAQSQAAVSATQEKLTNSAEKSSALKDKISGIKESVSQGAQESQARTSALSAVKDKAQSLSTEIKSNAVKANNGFRQKAIINKDIQPLDKGAWLDKAESIKVSVYKASETLAFGDSIQDGQQDNGEYLEMILPDAILEFCPKVSKEKLNDVNLLIDCLKDLTKHRSDSDTQVSENGNAIYSKMMSEMVVAVIGEGLVLKNIAANYQAKLEKQEEDLGSASTGRDDSAALAMTNKELQYVINKLLTVQTTILAVNAMQQLGGLDYSAFEEDKGE